MFLTILFGGKGRSKRQRYKISVRKLRTRSGQLPKPLNWVETIAIFIEGEN